jgi:hypothetical protein
MRDDDGAEESAQEDSAHRRRKKKETEIFCAVSFLSFFLWSLELDWNTVGIQLELLSTMVFYLIGLGLYDERVRALSLSPLSPLFSLFFVLFFTRASALTHTHCVALAPSVGYHSAWIGDCETV